ncbi:Uncharacterised protein [Mycobacteroides abscessus subsp. abscessus]|nr:Uncharacterised protein [Mycobacteroides abscessus subsp. abscessus]
MQRRSSISSTGRSATRATTDFAKCRVAANRALKSSDRASLHRG